jgi:chromosome segregation ATPase
VKSLGIAQPILNYRVSALEAQQRSALAQQAASAEDLATLEMRQSALESDHSVIEAALSEVRWDHLGLRAARESTNRTERELMELAAEVRSVRSGTEAALEALSRQADAAEERPSREAEEFAALWAFAELVLALEWLSRGEADVARLAAELAALRGRPDGAKAARGAQQKLGGLDKREADIARVASEGGSPPLSRTGRARRIR